MSWKAILFLLLLLLNQRLVQVDVMLRAAAIGGSCNAR